MKKFFIIVAVVSILLLPSLPAKAFSLMDNVSTTCWSPGTTDLKAKINIGDCTICDVLQVAFNFAKFIFASMAGLVLLFIIWQSVGMIMNWGNAEAIKAATDKMKSTLLAALIILAAYTLVGAMINVYSGGNFKTFIKGQTSSSWSVGPKCESGSRPTMEQTYDGGYSSITDGGCRSSWETGNGPTCGGNCGNLGLRTDARQCQDASPKLTALLDCINMNLFRVGSSKDYPNLANKLLNVNSISISPAGGGGLMLCRTNYVKSKCTHAKNSCHFGGGSLTDGSHAVDIDDKYADGSAVDFDELRRLTQACDPGRYIVLESDHIHLSDSKCPKD